MGDTTISERRSALDEARTFLERETQFHLGLLITEQPHPKTCSFSQTIARDSAAGIRMLQSVDDDIPAMAGRVFKSDTYARLCDDMFDTLSHGGRICFSGCGATGRLAILLEASWRRLWKALKTSQSLIASQFPDAENRVLSIMTGGDYALIRSVEFFEDYQEFGREQVRGTGLGKGDMLVAISEGGETSSVIGTIHEAVDRGAKAHFVFNNPSDMLVKLVERSRAVIDDPRVRSMSIATGPMAIAGSTRMQATSSELLVVGCALESALVRWLKEIGGQDMSGDSIICETDGCRLIRTTLAAISADTNVKVLSDAAEREARIYHAGGAVTYFAREALIDIFTDTTERSPTFMLPPFRRMDDSVSPRPWSFVKHADRSSREAWLDVFGREPRCLAWNAEDYERMGAPERARPLPRIGREDLMQFMIGYEDDASRHEHATDTAVSVLLAREVSDLQRTRGHDPLFFAYESMLPPLADFSNRYTIIIGDGADDDVSSDVIRLRIPLASSPLRLSEHIAVKLVMNTISTAAMGLLGRVEGNWMIHVDTSNKKLIDRGTRLVAELACLSYDDACRELFISRAEIARDASLRISPVAMTLDRVNKSGVQK